MMVGAFALAAYSWVVCVLLKRFLLSSWTATLAALVVWFAVVLVYPRPCFNSHDRSVQVFRPSSDALVRVSRQISCWAGQ
jgi:hypothetical protein